MSKTKAYASAGVDIDLADSLKSGLKASLKKASRPEVLGGIGAFGGLFSLKSLNYKNPVLVSSIDGVGTKLRLAFENDRHDSVGRDLVNHCINDIAVMGAEPLFFLDYIGTGKLLPEVFHRLVGGMAGACADSNCALIGGETAQMPGFYKDGEYDLVGTIVGIVERDGIVAGESIAEGDVLIGLESSGLHTNGYSLARQIFFAQLRYRIDDRIPGSEQTLLDALLEPHRCYLPVLRELFGRQTNFKEEGKPLLINGAAHITGGGFTGNVNRVLADHLQAVVDIDSWPCRGIFSILRNESNVDPNELYEVFNMGIGVVLVVPEVNADTVLDTCAKLNFPAWKIGHVRQRPEGQGQVKMQF
jgi:phosphoribosylformylglycinamidine cyclo-ligase